jgi:co-chaperonin GroES (HSP10)
VIIEASRETISDLVRITYSLQMNPAALPIWPRKHHYMHSTQYIRRNRRQACTMAAVAVLALTGPMQLCGRAQTAAAPAASSLPHQAGTVKATSADGLTLTNATGQEYTVSVPDAAKILVVPPGSKDLKSATVGTLSDVAAGDKVIVNGSAGDTGMALKATRVILMKSAAIAESHAAEEAAWAQGLGGIVKSVDAGAGKLVIASGLKTVTVQTTPQTVVKHYSGESVRFSDATLSKITDIKPGDQLRVRGAKSADGSTITADAMVAGTFHNYSGLITAIDPTASTVTLKDLATKKSVTVEVTSSSDVRRIPAMAAQMIAARMKGGTATPAAGVPPAGAAPGGGAGYAGAGGARGPGGYSGGGATGRAGADLSQMLARLPTETLGGLKTGDAVMIVATSPAADAGKSTAVTLLAGVDALLTASPAGEMTLSPWSVGGEAPSDGGGGGAP